MPSRRATRSPARRLAPAAGLLTTGLMTALALTGCGGGSTDTDTAAATTDAGEIGATDLAAAGCPDVVTIQTDWNPEAEHGGLYQMLGDDPAIDAGGKTVRGSLVDAAGDPTGVELEVRAGGPAIGFEPVVTQMYTDDAITLGYADTDAQTRLSSTQPTVSVVAPLDVNPQMIMWDPETYPDVQTIADLGRTDATILFFEGSSYMDYFTGAGIVDEANTNGSYDGSPAAFVAAQGEAAQQGFASAEPYLYEEEVDAWGKPVDFELLDDAGFPTYVATLSVVPENLETLSGCLTELVPVVQQAQVDYVADPGGTNELILELVEEYDTGWVYSRGMADFSVEQQLELGLVGNGENETLGDFDLERVQETIDIVTPIATEQGTPPTPGLTAEDLVTNEFIDDSIGLPS